MKRVVLTLSIALVLAAPASAAAPTITASWAQPDGLVACAP